MWFQQISLFLFQSENKWEQNYHKLLIWRSLKISCWLAVSAWQLNCVTTHGVRWISLGVRNRYLLVYSEYSGHVPFLSDLMACSWAVVSLYWAKVRGYTQVKISVRFNGTEDQKNVVLPEKLGEITIEIRKSKQNWKRTRTCVLVHCSCWKMLNVLILLHSFNLNDTFNKSLAM